jgi:hypothetical protein
MQLLGCEHDLCKREGTDQGNSVAYKICGRLLHARPAGMGAAA